MKRHTLTPGLAALLAINLIAAAPATAAINVGDKPNLNFVGVGGEKVSLAKLKGKIVVIDFWATWCGPCMAMADEMVAMNKEYGPKGLQMIGISLDSNKAKLVEVVKEKQFAWPHYYDGLGWKNKVWEQWGEGGIPFTVLLSPEGEVLWKGHPGSGLKEQIDKAFTDHPPKAPEEKKGKTGSKASSK